MQAVFHAGERLKGRFQGLNAAVAGVIPLLQLAQGEAAAAQNFLLQACGGKFRCGGNPRGDIFTAGNIDATVFRRSKISTALSKREIPRVMLFRLISSHAVVIKISVGFQAKHTDQLWAEHRAMLDAHRIHDTAVRIHTDKKIPFADKISQCVCHTRTPLCYQSQKPTCGMRRFPALCRQLLSYQKAANFCKRFVRFYTFMTIFFQRQIASPSPSVSLSVWPMGLFTSRVAIPSAGVGCLLMTTRSSPRK